MAHSPRLFKGLGTCLLFVLCLPFSFPTTGNAAQVTLAWDAATDPRVAGYRLYYGTRSRQYTLLGDAGKQTTSIASGLAEGTTYYFAVTDYDSQGLESAYSNEVSYAVPGCAYSISPTQRSFTSSGGTGTISVLTPSGCRWTASGTSWMTITSGASGTGSGTVAYKIAANTTASSRTVATTVASRPFTVTQAGTTGFTVTASAGTGGSISPAGSVAVAYGASRTFTITPASGYRINSVTVDGSLVGAVNSYTFTNVTANHTIAATFGK